MDDVIAKKSPKWEYSIIVLKAIFKDIKICVGSELGYSVIDRLIRNVEVKDDHIVLAMILTTPFCPYGMLIESVRKL